MKRKKWFRFILVLLVYGIMGILVSSNISIKKVNLLIASAKEKSYRNDRILIWNDEFDGSKLDSSDWQIMTGKFLSYSKLWRAEKQVSIENGCLVLSSEPSNQYKQQYNCDFIGGELRTNARHALRDGRIEVRAKIENPESSYFSIWFEGQCGGWDTTNYDYTDENNVQHYGDTYGMHWAKCGEIDLTESAYSNQMESALHWSDITDENTGKSAGRRKINDSDYHTYALEKYGTTLDFYLDDELISHQDTSKLTFFDKYNPFTMPQFLIMSITTDEKHYNGKPVKAYIDWVRIYAPSNVTLQETIPKNIYIREYGKDNQLNSLILPVGTWKLLDGKYDVVNVSDEPFTFSSSNPEVATTYGGLIKCQEEGSTIITIKDNLHGLSNQMLLTVSNSNIETVNGRLEDAELSNWKTYICENNVAVSNGYYECKEKKEYKFTKRGVEGLSIFLMEYDKNNNLLCQTQIENGKAIVTSDLTAKVKIKLDANQKGYYAAIYYLKNGLIQFSYVEANEVSIIDTSKINIPDVEQLLNGAFNNLDFPYYIVFYDPVARDKDYTYQLVRTSKPINRIYDATVKSNKIYYYVLDENGNKSYFKNTFAHSADGINWSKGSTPSEQPAFDVNSSSMDTKIIISNYDVNKL